jgi:transposase
VFPEALKREAVERVTSSGLSASQVAQELGLHETVLRRWVRDLAPQATGPARRPIPQVAALSPADQAAEKRPAQAGERAPADGARHPKKAALIFGAASR